MKHRNKTRQLTRGHEARLALLRGLARSLVLSNKIKTTETRAKELRPFVEKLVTRAREDTLTARRILISRLGDSVTVSHLMKDIAPKYKERHGGYTRITKLPKRAGDASRMAYIEFV